MLPTEAQFEGNWSGPPQPLVNSDDEEDEDFITFTQSDADYFASAKLDSIGNVQLWLTSWQFCTLDGV